MAKTTRKADSKPINADLRPQDGPQLLIVLNHQELRKLNFSGIRLNILNLFREISYKKNKNIFKFNIDLFQFIIRASLE